ncbi:MAG: hypothetical protein MJ172_03380 [Clostridia bacterium]|nr:hypothetical protein [Clostridia bacterium]
MRRFTLPLSIILIFSLVSCSSGVTPTSVSELTATISESVTVTVQENLAETESLNSYNEALEILNMARYELSLDHPSTAVDLTLEAMSMPDFPDNTDASYILSEALCVYGIGKTYRAVENSWEIPEDAVILTSIGMEGMEYSVNLEEPEQIRCKNLETGEEEIVDYGRSVLLIAEENGSVFAFLSDGTVETVVRGLGTRPNFLIKLDVVTAAYKITDGFILVDQGGAAITYKAVRGPVTTVVTHTDSDAVQPMPVNQQNSPYKIDFDSETNSYLIDVGDGTTHSVISENGRPITNVNVSGDYIILSDDVQAIGYIIYKDCLIAAIDKFIAFDPSDVSVYVGADAIINIPVYSPDELSDMAYKQDM